MSTAVATGLSCALYVVLALAIAPGAARGATAPGLRQLRFSPDGRYVLAQDDAGITVLTVQPFAVLFQAPAQDATDANFTADSHEILFVSSLTQVNSQQIAIRHSPANVERWSITDRKRISLREITLPACGTVGLSPDGSFVACDDLGGVFRLHEVVSGATVLERKFFGQAVLGYVLGGNHPDDPSYTVQFDGKIGSALIAFSTDGRYLVAVPERCGNEAAVAWDFRLKKTVRPNGAVRRLRFSADAHVYYSAPPFTFVGPDRAVISWPQAWNPKDTTVTATLTLFPTGKKLLRPRIPPGPLFRAADPAFVIVRPCGKAAACAAEYATGQVIISEKSPALDVLGRYYVSELATDEVGLYERGKGLQAAVALGTKSPGTGSAGPSPMTEDNPRYLAGTKLKLEMYTSSVPGR